MTNNTTILQLATIQQTVAEMHKQTKGLCAFNQDGIHLLDYKFVDLFHGKREFVARKDFDQGGNKPFYYYTHMFGVKFFCISDKIDLFPSHPVESLADDLINKWDSQDDPNRYRVIYRDGSYYLAQILNINKDEPIIYTFEQYDSDDYSDESISLEQAILDHMEVVHNGK